MSRKCSGTRSRTVSAGPSTEWGFLVHVVDPDSPPGAIADVGPDQLPQMPDGECGRGETAAGQLTEDDLEDGMLVADGYQRLRDDGGVGTEPHSLCLRRV